VLGLVVGIGLDLTSPPSYQATTSVLLTHGPNENPVDAMQTDAALAHSQSVAQLVMRKLPLNESASAFLATVTVTPITDRVILITVSAPSSSQAVTRAAALAAEFLQFRANQLQVQQQLQVTALQQQISQARQNIASMTGQLSQLSAQPSSAERQAEITKLTNQRSDAVTALNGLQQTTAGEQASGQATITAEVKGSQVLDPATPVHRSGLKYAVIYAVMGLVAGLVIGLAFVIIRALISDRLRRRDDIADALGVSVNLSVGDIDRPRWLPDRPGAKSARAHDMQRIVAHLRDALPDGASGAAALAVVPVDNERTAARSVVALALSCAGQGQKVLVADLCRGTPAARLLGAAGPGVQTVTVDGAEVTVTVPGPGEIMPVGPVRPPAPDAPGDEALAAAYTSAGVLLTLVPLDPSLGADHLRSWARDAVVIVTAGRSSWMRLHAAGEMISLARVPLVSAILTGADKTDESLGMTQAAARRSPAARLRGL
jgi:capsular polysaccharide biosynthesis protein